MVLKLGHFGKQMTSDLKVSKCGVEEGWKKISCTDRVKQISTITLSQKGKEHPRHNKKTGG